MAPVDARVLVITPTYNEAGNLERVLADLLRRHPRAEVLVVDDDSPDGTGAIADSLATDDARVHVLHRTRKSGLGAAYLDGFAWAMARDYDAIVQMDADGSHPAEALHAMLTALDDGAGLVIGSRWVPGGAVADWPRRRELLSRAGNTYARAVLGLSVRDATAGYRAWRTDALAAVPLAQIVSRGYCFQVDLTRRAIDAGVTVAESPIVFAERTHGRSKMSGAIVVEAMLRVTWWGMGRMLRRNRTANRPAAQPAPSR